MRITGLSAHVAAPHPYRGLSDVWRSGLTTAQTLPVLLVMAFFVCGAMLGWQDDSWWQLRCGQLIWTTGTVPQADPFSFGAGPGAFWPNHEWLAQVLMYGAYSLGGLPLVNLGGGAVVALAGCCLLRAMSGSTERKFLLILLILPWIVAALSARPQIFTVLGVTVTMWLLLEGRYRLLPVVFLLWANLHGAVAVGGLLMVGATLAAALFDRTRLRPLALTTSACGAATLLTPLGPRILLFPIESVGRLKQLELTEWMTPGFAQWQHLYFWGLLVGVGMTVAPRARHARAWPDRMLIVLSGLLAVMAVMSVRNVPLFLIVAAIMISRLLPARPRAVEAPERKNIAVVGVFGLAAVLGIGTAYGLPWQRLAWQPLPAEALAAIRSCPQPMFNTYNTGGYLLWFAPERAVFIDSRQDPFPIDLLCETVRTQRSGNYEALFEEYGFRSAVMERGWPLGLRLIENGWQTVFRDEDWLVLERGQP